MKNYRFYENEMDSLGQRLDAARRAQAEATSEWAKVHWQQVVDRLLLQWQHLPILHDGDAQVTLIPRYEIDYDFFEQGYAIEGAGFTDRMYHKLVREGSNLDKSWENHRAARLAKAQ